MHSCKGLVASGPFKNNQCQTAYQMIKNSKNNREADFWCMKTDNCKFTHTDTTQLQKLQKNYEILKKKYLKLIEEQHLKENEIIKFSKILQELPYILQDETQNYNEQEFITKKYIEEKNKIINENQLKEEKLLNKSKDYIEKNYTASRNLDYSYDTYRYYNYILKIIKYFIILLIVTILIIVAYKNKHLIKKYI